MEITFLLCDAAQAVDGKLNLLGGGWTTVRVAEGQGINMALAAIVTVDWNETNQSTVVSARLENEDGGEVLIGDEAIQIQTILEVGRPAGVRQGSSFNVAIAIPISQMPLPPGGYVWALSSDGQEYARRPFTVEPLH